MNKIIKLYFFMVVILGIIFNGCGKGESGQEKGTAIDEDHKLIHEYAGSDDKDKKKENVLTEEEVDYADQYTDIYIKIESLFSDGYAWVKSNNRLYCIDETGNEVFKLNEKYSSPTEIINGYFIVDSKYVLNMKEEIVCTIDDSYEVYDYQPLEVGCVILAKEIDEYERSGKFFYILDLETKNIEEIDLRNCNYYTKDRYTYTGNGLGVSDEIAKLGEYIGNGKYTIVLPKYRNNYEINLAPRIYSTIQFFDVKTGSIQECDPGLGDKYEGTINKIYNTDDKDVKYLTISNHTILRLNVENCQVLGKIDNTHEGWGFDTPETPKLIENNLLRILYGNEDHSIFKYLDMNTDTMYELNTEFQDSDVKNMEYEVIAYKNGIFMLKMKNDAGSLYFVLVDERGKTLLKPTKYNYAGMFSPSFLGKNVAYHDGENFCFIDSKSGMLLNKLQMKSDTIIGAFDRKFPDSKCYDSGDDGLLVHEENGKHFIYNSTGNKIVETGEFDNENESNQHYYLINNIDSRGRNQFVDIQGNVLKIKLYD